MGGASSLASFSGLEREEEEEKSFDIPFRSSFNARARENWSLNVLIRHF